MKKIFICLCVIFVVAFSATTICAADWREIGRDDTGIVSIDISSIRQYGNKFRVWMKCIYRTAKEKNKVRTICKLHDIPEFSLDYLEFKLDEPLDKAVSYSIRSKNKVLLECNSYENYAPIPPDSYSDIIWHLCRKHLGFE